MDAHHSSRVSPVERNTPRAERHPNSVTAPPLNRGSMVPVPWRGFWNSLGAAALLRLTGRAAAAPAASAPGLPAEPWQGAARRRRWTFALLTVLTTALASVLFAGVQPDYENAWLGAGQIALFALLSLIFVYRFVPETKGRSLEDMDGGLPARR